MLIRNFQAFTDPGILPRSLDLDPPYPNHSPSDGGPNAPLPRDLKVRAGMYVSLSSCRSFHLKHF